MVQLERAKLRDEMLRVFYFSVAFSIFNPQKQKWIASTKFYL
jgi:hypothetical protein